MYCQSFLFSQQHIMNIIPCEHMIYLILTFLISWAYFSIEKMAIHGLKKIKPSKREFNEKQPSLLFTLEILFKDCIVFHGIVVPLTYLTVSLLMDFCLDFGGDFAFSNSVSMYISVPVLSWTWAYFPGQIYQVWN